jgi:putative zinc finger/helix-turn-helix YgiT family protein
MVAVGHNCHKKALTKLATAAEPYHFIESGLPNVYLIGIEYRICPDCNLQSAEIPAIEDLMKKIARAVVQKHGQMSGSEVRFLRKRLRMKSSVFARVIGVSPEQVTRWEQDDNARSESADKLIRVFYCILSNDDALEEIVNEHITVWLSAMSNEKTAEPITAELRDREWEPVPAGSEK